MNLPCRYRLTTICLLLALLGAVWPCRAGEPNLSQHAAVAKPAVEKYRYDIAFLWFDRIAEARLSLHPQKGTDCWEAELEANTLGVAAWLTSDRAHNYASFMELEDDGAFTSVQHDSNIIKTKKGQRRVRLKSYLFDHERHEIVKRVNRNGRQKDDVVLPMPEIKPNDILTAFYNFRRGLYGPVKPGNSYRIPTYTRNGSSEIIVEAFGPSKRPASPKFPEDGLLLKVQLDKEVFDTDNGIVYVWLDDKGRPAQVVVEDIIGLGDVRCTLREEENRS